MLIRRDVYYMEETKVTRDTKEEILITALHRFARDGYEAVSVSQIAGDLSITKGALYRHYKNKRPEESGYLPDRRRALKGQQSP